MLTPPHRARTRRRSADNGGKRARSPGRARRKPLKPLRAGTSGDSGVLVVARVHSTNTKCTRGRGCQGRPAFPTPSDWRGRQVYSKTRAKRAARSRRCVCKRSGCLKMNLGSVRHAGLRSRRKAHPSCPDLIRPSINLRDKFFQRGWITGSKPGDDGLIGMTASGFLAETAALEPIRRADAPLFLVLLLAADGLQLREHRIDIEVVALLFGRLVFRLLPGGL